MDNQLLLIFHIRSLFEQRRICRHLLADLYMNYNPISEIDLFIIKSQFLFPKFNCGIASLYLKYILREGEVIQGNYAAQAHTYLRLKENIIDITADQFNGPRIYRAPEEYPWRGNDFF